MQISNNFFVWVTIMFLVIDDLALELVDNPTNVPIPANVLEPN